MRSKNTIYNIATNLLKQFITIIYGFIVPKIIIENFGSNVNGLVTSITQFLAYISLLESGIGPVVKATLYKPIAKNKKKSIENILRASEKFFRIIALIFLIYIIALSIIYPFIVSKEFEFLYTFSLIIIISISTFAEYYFGMTYKLYLQAEQKSYINYLIQSFIYIISIVITIILVKFNASIHTIKLISGIIFILRPLIQNIYVKKKYKINLKNANNNYKLEQKWDGLAQHIASVIHNNTDTTILTLFCSLSEISVYNVYYLVVGGIKSIVQSFANGLTDSFGNIIAKKEDENLREKFTMYESVYFSIATIFYTCTIILIIPFISIYTKDITDANYIRPLFGVLLVISEFIWAIRIPYNNIVLAAGHFKETKKGAWIEALTNIIISLILVKRYGLIGVAIGTTTAMLIRTIELIYYTNKYILKRNISSSIKKILFIIIESLLIITIEKCMPQLNNTSYIAWIINSMITFIYSTTIVLTINNIAFKNEFKTLKNILKNIFNKRKKEVSNND